MPGRFAGIYLARHGETDYNAEARFQGRLPVPLNARGRAQAAELAERAAAFGFEALYTSTLVRARETALIVAARIGLEPVLEPRLVETDSGDWTDRPFAEVQREDPPRFAGFVEGDPAFAFPSGESFKAQSDRVAAALEDIAAHAPRPALAVCHGVVIRLALTRLGGASQAASRRVANAAIVPLDRDEAAGFDEGGGEATPAA